MTDEPGALGVDASTNLLGAATGNPSFTEGRLRSVTTERDPDPLGRVDSLVETISAAHLAIFRRHRRVVDAGRADAEIRALLDESAAAALTLAPDAIRHARDLAYELTINELLGPVSDETWEALRDAVERAEAGLRELLRRQQQIADLLSARLEEDDR